MDSVIEVSKHFVKTYELFYLLIDVSPIFKN